MKNGNGRQLFTPIEVGRVSGRVADQIRDAIRAKELVPGDRLPSERELANQFGVSRVTIRDALRSLQAVGLLEVKLGAQGGAFVRSPGPDVIAEGFANMLLTSGMTAVEVTEARQTFELGIIGLATARATPEDLAALEQICEEGEASLAQEAYDVSHSSAFHAMLARCTHNAAIVAIVDSLQGPLHDSLVEAKALDPALGTRGGREHREIVQALRDGDADRARQIMTVHLERTAQRLKERIDATANGEELPPRATAP